MLRKSHTVNFLTIPTTAFHAKRFHLPHATQDGDYFQQVFVRRRYTHSHKTTHKFSFANVIILTSTDEDVIILICRRDPCSIIYMIYSRADENIALQTLRHKQPAMNLPTLRYSPKTTPTMFMERYNVSIYSISLPTCVAQFNESWKLHLLKKH
jgi:hypothetical protein